MEKILEELLPIIIIIGGWLISIFIEKNKNTGRDSTGSRKRERTFKDIEITKTKKPVKYDISIETKLETIKKTAAKKEPVIENIIIGKELQEVQQEEEQIEYELTIDKLQEGIILSAILEQPRALYYLKRR